MLGSYAIPVCSRVAVLVRKSLSIQGFQLLNVKTLIKFNQIFLTMVSGSEKLSEFLIFSLKPPKIKNLQGLSSTVKFTSLIFLRSYMIVFYDHQSGYQVRAS